MKNSSIRSKKVGLVSGETVLSYKELLDNIYRASHILFSLGVREGDRVIITASSSVNFVFGYFAIHLLGAIAVPIAPDIQSDRLRFIVSKVLPKVTFLTKQVVEIQNSYLLNSLGEGGSKSELFFKPNQNMVADILFTTGTTDEPKGVVLTHGNILSAAKNINLFIGNNHYDREIIPLPLSHSFGLGRLRCSILSGSTIILVEGMISAGEIFDAFENWNATGFSFVPSGWSILHRLTGDAINKYAHQLNYVEIGSSPMSLDSKRFLMELLPRTRICMHYGLTEASRSTFIEFHESSDYLDSIGLPTPGVEIRILNKDDQEVPFGDQGEICVRGSHVMKQYWKLPKETASVLKSGSLHTGDIGRKDENNYIYLIGRKKEMIIVGGRNVIPNEIEKVLNQNENILDCACIGVPDPNGILGEVIKAFLVPLGKYKPNKKELIVFLRDKLDYYKIPLEYEWIKGIPKSKSGKVQRWLLK